MGDFVTQTHKSPSVAAFSLTVKRKTKEHHRWAVESLSGGNLWGNKLRAAWMETSFSSANRPSHEHFPTFLSDEVAPQLQQDSWETTSVNRFATFLFAPWTLLAGCGSSRESLSPCASKTFLELVKIHYLIPSPRKSQFPAGWATFAAKSYSEQLFWEMTEFFWK